MAPKTKVELCAAIRRDSRMEGLSVRALARKYGVHRRTWTGFREYADSPEGSARRPSR